MTRLSVNINKIATLRNARGGNVPDVLLAARRCEQFGAQGITVHPRPDERHIRYSDVRQLKGIVTTELNIEGNPTESFRNLVLEVCPDQVTLVPDGPDALTSDAGWDTVRNKDFLTGMCSLFKSRGIRVSIFTDPVPEMVRGAALCGADRVELYTAGYAEHFAGNPSKAVEPYIRAAEEAGRCGLGLNAGHDLNLENLAFFIRSIPRTDEVSIGHALVSDALYLGLEKTIAAYLGEIQKF